MFLVFRRNLATDTAATKFADAVKSVQSDSTHYRDRGRPARTEREKVFCAAFGGLTESSWSVCALFRLPAWLVRVA